MIEYEKFTMEGYMTCRRACVRMAYESGSMTFNYRNGQEEERIKQAVKTYNHDISHKEAKHVKCQFDKISTVTLSVVVYDEKQRRITENSNPNKNRNKKK